MDKRKIYDKAKVIAGVLRDTDTDYRGDVLLEAARILRMENQGFTSGILQAAGRAYGRSK